MVVGESDAPQERGTDDPATAPNEPLDEHRDQDARLDSHAARRPTDDELARAALDPAIAALLDAAADSDPPDELPAGDSKPDAPGATMSSFTAVAPPVETASSRPAPVAPDDLAASITVRAVAGQPEPMPAALEPGHTEFQAIIRQSVVEMIRAHGEANPGIEVCGVMVGTVFENPQAAFVYVDAMIRGESSSGRSTQVTFTAETWQHIDRVMEERHKGKRILGWYHTHPGFGIFLSEMDLFIQRHFFNAPWQMAFVYDPKSHEAGMFAWRQGQVRRVDFVIDDEASSRSMAESLPGPLGGIQPTVSPAPLVTSTPHSGGDDAAAPVNTATLNELAERVRVLETRVRWLLVGFAILALVAIIWPLVVGVVMPNPQPASPTPAGTQQPPAKPPPGPMLPDPARVGR